ncbi:S-layer homology domain-containing protein [Deinococcus peraridilitoris]|uniref:Putative S-layer protein n=1 Tax=Deinococcus peraridilitoris (strain DSM 19664 / LMG 22246 / CIP 109416 / KR-200) TaxID=937777 RepID=K9ZYF3_DEIPD|nr:S-layer homology domain-containing protein [Deinococcus peraridilitoris]AFZ66678.1 putative S-layer protein [Deinococcus peraridilitoris DSM 19664]
MKLKALLALTVTLTLGVAAAQGTSTTTTQAPTLSDVPAGHWAADAVSRLVSEGVILGFPDGTFRGNENLTRYQAAVIIARVLDQIAQGNVQVEGDTMTSLQNAVQELAADLAALGVRVADLEENAATKDDIARIEERLNDLGVAGGDEGAVTELQGTIDELTARVDELSSNFDTLRADVDDNASSIAALNDLTVLLNQDILSLQDRVSALETGKADRADLDALAGRVGGVETRLGAVEALPRVTLTGGLNANFGSVGLVSGTTAFDIDRLTTNTFLGGSLGDNNVTTVDTAPPGSAVATGGITFGLGVNNIRTANNTITINNANLNFVVRNVFASPVAASDTVVALSGANATGTIAGQQFGVAYSASNSTFSFNPAFFNNTDAGARRGVVATINATTLPFAPKLTAVVGVGATAALPASYFGIRAEINPFGLGNLGVSYATNALRDGLSADARFNVGPIALESVYVTSVPRTGVGFAGADNSFFVRATTNLGGFNLGANFRAIDPDFGAIGSVNPVAMGVNNNRYASDQVGFGVAATTTFSIVNLGAYYDNQTGYVAGTPAVGRAGTVFGVTAGATLFRAVSLTAFYNGASTGGVAVAGTSNSLTTTYDGGLAPAPFFGTSSFGAIVRHNGAAADALISGLNITAGFGRFYTVGANDFQVFANYSGNVGGLFTLTPYARYHMNTGGAATTVDAAGATVPAVGYSTFKVGSGFTTTPLNVVFSPSVTGGVAYRSTAFATGGTTSELYANGNLVLNNIFAENTSLGFGYSTYTATGVAALATGVSNSAFDASVDRIYGNPPAGAFAAGPGATSGSVNGFFTQLNVYGVKASYGVFTLTDTTAGTTSAASGFRVGYDVRF